MEFIREAQNYYVDQHGRFSDPDDCIDSARYALIGCLQGLAEPYDGRSPQQRFRALKHNIQAANQARTTNKPIWKTTHNPVG